MQIYEIPLTAEPQNFNIALGGVSYNMTARWNVPANCWVLDIADADNVRTLNGIPLVTGTNLLGQYAHLNFGGTLTASTDGDGNLIPTYENLGDKSHLYFTVS